MLPQNSPLHPPSSAGGTTSHPETSQQNHRCRTKQPTETTSPLPFPSQKLFPPIPHPAGEDNGDRSCQKPVTTSPVLPCVKYSSAHSNIHTLGFYCCLMMQTHPLLTHFNPGAEHTCCSSTTSSPRNVPRLVWLCQRSFSNLRQVELLTTSSAQLAPALRAQLP